MNVFLIQPDIRASCEELAKLDPIRARKQLVECCQVLASVEHALTGKCTLIKANGQPYGRSHPHHPCVVQACKAFKQWNLTYEVAFQLADVFPAHACAKSFRAWNCAESVLSTGPATSLLVVRRNHPHTYVNTLAEYVSLMRPYFLAKLGANNA